MTTKTEGNMKRFFLLTFFFSPRFIRELRTTAAAMLNLTKNTVGNVFALLRRYCGQDLQDRPVIPFGGRVFVVKCDESQFTHKAKVSQNIHSIPR